MNCSSIVWKKGVAILLTAAMVLTSAGCSNTSKKKAKPSSTSTADVTSKDVSSEDIDDLPEIEAGGKGKDKSDVPLVIACTSFQKEFNPFTAKAEDDRKAMGLTQLRLLTFDRSGAVVSHAIKGERRRFQGEEYSYQGPASIHIHYDKETELTEYEVRLKKGLTFSDGEPVTVEDLLFSMHAFADKSYQGGETFGNLPIVGIEQVDEQKVKITVKGYRRDDVRSLNIPICPLHVYGNVEKYDYDSEKYGFDQGDISSLYNDKKIPIGAGPYKFIKYEKGIVYYEANEKYYRGCPQTAFIQLKELGDRQEVEKLDALANGDFDVVDLPGSNDAIDMIKMNNSSGKLTGKIFSGYLYDGGEYAYIGMNARQVCVDKKPDSTRSKLLRQALAVLFSCSREKITEVYERGAKPINYPADSDVWYVPQTEDAEYEQAYVKDVQGNVIYNSGMEENERTEAACAAALGYLKEAGFRVKNGMVKKSPDNTPMEFTIIVPQERPKIGLETLAYITKRMFKKIGLKLIIVNQPLKKAMKKGNYQLWCGSAKTSVSGELNQMFHSEGEDKDDKEAGSQNYFHIEDSDLDEYIEESLETTKQKKSITLYEQCYQKVLEWGVIVPMYQRQEMTVFSSSRVNMDTVTGDMTEYYDWTQAIETIEMT